MKSRLHALTIPFIGIGIVVGGLTWAPRSVSGRPHKQYVLEIPNNPDGPGALRVFRSSDSLKECILKAHLEDGGGLLDVFGNIMEPEIRVLHRGNRKTVTLLEATLGESSCGSWGCHTMVLERRGPSRWRQVFSSFLASLETLKSWRDDRHPALLQMNRYGCAIHAAFLSRWNGYSYQPVAMEELGPLLISCALNEESLRLLKRECPKWIERMERLLQVGAAGSSAEGIDPDVGHQTTAAYISGEDPFSTFEQYGMALATRSCREKLNCSPQRAWGVTELPEDCASGRSLVLVTRYEHKREPEWSGEEDASEEDASEEDLLENSTFTPVCKPWLIGEGFAWRPGPGSWMPLHVPPTPLVTYPFSPGQNVHEWLAHRLEESNDPAPADALEDYAPLPWALDFLAECPPGCGQSEAPCPQVLEDAGGLSLGVTWYRRADLGHLPCDRSLVFF